MGHAILGVFHRGPFWNSLSALSICGSRLAGPDRLTVIPMQFDTRPMLATLTDKPFDDPDWVFETKWDGFRAIAVARLGHASLYSRNLNDISRKYPSVCQALAKIKDEADRRARTRGA